MSNDKGTCIVISITTTVNTIVLLNALDLPENIPQHLATFIMWVEELTLHKK